MEVGRKESWNPGSATKQDLRGKQKKQTCLTNSEHGRWDRGRCHTWHSGRYAPGCGIWSIYVLHNIIIILTYGARSLWVWSDGPQRARTWAKTINGAWGDHKPLCVWLQSGMPLHKFGVGIFFCFFWALDLVISNLDFFKAIDNYDLHVLRRQYCLYTVCPSKKKIYWRVQIWQNISFLTTKLVKRKLYIIYISQVVKR